MAVVAATAVGLVLGLGLYSSLGTASTTPTYLG